MRAGRGRSGTHPRVPGRPLFKRKGSVHNKDKLEVSVRFDQFGN